jgi:hypothetical protein
MVYAGRGRWVVWTGAALHLHRELTDGESDYHMDALALAAFGFATANLFVPNIQDSAIGWVATRAASAGWALTTAAAPITAGYMIGATVGTAIANEVWGEEGAQTALGFYSGGLLPGTETPDLTDYQYIFKPTAAGGPVSLYDVGQAGVRGTLREIGRFRKNYPSFYL